MGELLGCWLWLFRLRTCWWRETRDFFPSLPMSDSPKRRSWFGFIARAFPEVLILAFVNVSRFFFLRVFARAIELDNVLGITRDTLCNISANCNGFSALHLYYIHLISILWIGVLFTFRNTWYGHQVDFCSSCYFLRILNVLDHSVGCVSSSSRYFYVLEVYWAANWKTH